MSAQPPTVAVHDYLTEVRIFPSTSAEFAQAASQLGVSASLATLGAGAQLVAAIRNDSGQAVELRILFQLTKDGKTIPRDLEVGRTLAEGDVTLVAPREIKGVLAGLLNAGRLGLISGSPSVQPLDAYQGAQVTISVDSATLAGGKFIGADTQNFFDRLAAEDAAKKSFFSEVAGFQPAGLTQSQIEQALNKRRAAAQAAKSGSTGPADFNLAAVTESGLCMMALMRLEHFGMASLFEWAAKENAAVQSKPTLHR